MLRPALFAAALVAACSAQAAEVRLDYRVDFNREFDHLAGITTDLTGQSATGSITVDTGSLLTASSDGNITTAVLAAHSTWSYPAYPVPPTNDTDKLTLTFFLTGPYAGTVNLQNDLASTWPAGVGLTRDGTQAINLGGTFSALANTTMPSAAEVLAALQSTIGAPAGGFLAVHKVSSADVGTLAYSDVLGTVTVTAVTAVPAPSSGCCWAPAWARWRCPCCAGIAAAEHPPAYEEKRPPEGGRFISVQARLHHLPGTLPSTPMT